MHDKYLVAILPLKAQDYFASVRVRAILALEAK